ncbi:MAG TPA: zinc ABC transporter substrate-binding protein [Alphaproteobacteria bacterium]|nr:zinc ABC transporter substrate-binding protein [Alphaproteobacteria bacterium]
MQPLPRARAIGLLFAVASFAGPATAAQLRVVAAENVYGDIAAQIGGDAVSVISILNNPAQDPHLFEASASAARAVADADLVIYNGANYDPWMPKLLAASPSAKRKVIVVSDIGHLPPGDNPHLWYEWSAVRAAGNAIAQIMANADGAGSPGYLARAKTFSDSLQAIADLAAAMNKKYAGTPVAATEPVFEYMARHIGLDVQDAAFQRAIMNGTEPGARDVAAFEADLKGHRVKVLIYNMQSSGNLVQRMRSIAELAEVPVVGVSETEPPDMRYQDWMLGELNALDAALSKGGP